MDYESIVNKYGFTTKQFTFDYDIYDLLLNMQNSYISYLPHEIIKYIICEFLMESAKQYTFEREDYTFRYHNFDKQFYECLDKYEIFLIVYGEEYTIGKRINTSKYIYSSHIFDVIYSTNDKYNISKIIQLYYEDGVMDWFYGCGNPPGINIDIVKKIEDNGIYIGDNKSYDEITLIPLYNK